MRLELQKTIDELGLSDFVDLVGEVVNPFAWFNRSDLFVMSSLWEGFGNVIVEALACGCNIVSTDCPSGPREILDDGRYGKLVAVDSVDALAAGIGEMLDHPLPEETLIARAKQFSVEAATNAYLKLASLPQYPAT